MARVERVLIVGSGMAGLSLAIALRQRGVAAEIVERAHDGAGAGAGLYLVGLGTRALGALGLTGAAQGEGYISRTQTFRNHRGARLAELDVAGSGSAFLLVPIGSDRVYCYPRLHVNPVPFNRLMNSTRRGPTRCCTDTPVSPALPRINFAPTMKRFTLASGCSA